MTREITGTIDGDTVRIRSAYGEQHGDSLNLTFSGKVSGRPDDGHARHGRVPGRDVDGDASRGAERLMLVRARSIRLPELAQAGPCRSRMTSWRSQRPLWP